MMRNSLQTLFVVGFLSGVPAFAATLEAPHEQAAGAHLPQDYERQEAAWLTHEEAILRAQTVSDVSYELDIDLTGEEIYSGIVTISFDYEPSPHPLTLDFLGGAVESIEIGEESVPVVYSRHHITVEPGLLSQGRNNITVQYSHSYSETGAGLYRYVDSTDGRVYLYTHFEPYDANQLAPMFDQPNLRAQWTLNVQVPNAWHVVTTVREESVERGGEGALWHFPPSPPISSYILPLHAGEYHVWESTAGEIPLRLFARESLAQDVRADWLLNLTAGGIAYFQEYFDEPYPFSKYDQLIVPDFNIGGMENVAAVTYTESYVPRGKPTTERLQGIANTFLHELSHMWFGDLVTIDWWNALWLKESFASLMAPMALPAATDFDSPWVAFYLGSKQSAYQADQFVTTHPIEMPVRDTKSGDASFDAITYSKGASVLKQLNHFLGEETFRDGVREYMNRLGWQAATLPNFMDTLAEVSGRNLQDWTADWLETAGVNTVKAEYECVEGKISSFRLAQTAPADYPTLRSHRLQVGLFGLVEDLIEPTRTVAIELSGAHTPVPELLGESCPVLVYPNVGDWAFIRVLLDDNSLQRVPGELNHIADPMLRSMFWQSLWDGVRDQSAALSEYLDVALSSLPAEQNTTILQRLLGNLDSARHYLFLFGDPAAELRREYLPALESMAWQQVLSSEAGSNRQKLWFDAWRSLAASEEALATMERWLRGESEPMSLVQDQDRRWRVLTRLASSGYPGIDALLASERERDPSDTGKMMAITMAAARPEAAAKARHLDAIEDLDSGRTSAQLKASIRSMFPPGQEALHSQFGARILSSLPTLDRHRDQDLIGAYTDLLPALCTAGSVRQLADAIRTGGGMTLGATKDLKVTHQEDQRCAAMAARQLGQ